MKNRLLAGLLLPCLLTGLGAQERTFENNVDGVVTGMTGSERDVSAVTNHLLDLEIKMAEVLRQVIDTYSLQLEVPEEADPGEVLAPFRRDPAPAQVTRAGFAKLSEKLDFLRASLEDKADPAEVKRTAEEVLVLMWALKGHCFLESIGFWEGDGGKVETETTPGGEPDYFVVGALGRLSRYSIRVRLDLLEDAVDSWGRNARGMAELRRYREFAGMNYPNATNPLGWGN